MPSDVDWTAVVMAVLEAARLPRPATIGRAEEGVGTHVFFAGDAVVRLGTGSDAVNFPRTVAILEAARDTVAVPAVLFADFDRESFPFPVMVLAHVPGEPMSRLWAKISDDERMALLAQVVDQLSRLHRLDPASLGPAAGLAACWWAERVARIERLLPVASARAGFPREWVDDMAAYVDAHRDALLAARPAGVLHNDVTWGNVIVHDESVAALIDFDDALAGPPEEDWWQLVFRTWESEPPLALARVRELHCFDDVGPGMLQRLKISEIQAALDLLSGELSWIRGDAAVEDARETYETAFQSTFFEDRFAQLL